MNNSIEHKGKIIELRDEVIVVEILNKSMCSACHAQSVCMMSDQKLKTIEVKRYNNQEYNIGEEVLVVLRRELGMRAVLITYIIPLIILLILLLTLSSLIGNDLLLGLIALLSIGIYFFCIYLFRNKIEHKFVFTIEKLNK